MSNSRGVAPLTSSASTSTNSALPFQGSAVPLFSIPENIGVENQAPQKSQIGGDDTPLASRADKIKSSVNAIESSFKAESESRPISEKQDVDDSGCIIEKIETEQRSSVQSESTAFEEPSRPNSSTTRLSTPFAQVRVLSYNIFLPPPGTASNSHKNSRLNQFATSILPSYDIICLQEIFSSGSARLAKLLAHAKKSGFDYHVASPAKGILNASIDGGLVIISRYPIVKTDKITFKRGVYGDRFTAKGAIYAKIKVAPGKYLHVFNTHLQSSIKDAPLLGADLASNQAIQTPSNTPASTPTVSGLYISTPAFLQVSATSPLFYRSRTSSSTTESSQANPQQQDVEINVAAAMRLAQLTALKEFIDDVVMRGAAAKSNASGEEPLVVLAGCFNINSRIDELKVRTPQKSGESREGQEYLNMLRLLRGDFAKGNSTTTTTAAATAALPSPARLQVMDLMYDAVGEHPVTFGNAGKPFLKQPETQCVDYILLLTPRKTLLQQKLYVDDDEGANGKTKVCATAAVVAKRFLTIADTGTLAERKHTHVEKIM
ncbi:hypothetical protein HK100_009482, partial [Physocladia obscura]